MGQAYKDVTVKCPKTFGHVVCESCIVYFVSDKPCKGTLDSFHSNNDIFHGTGTYLTNEAKGADDAPDADTAIINADGNHAHTEEKKEYFI